MLATYSIWDLGISGTVLREFSHLMLSRFRHPEYHVIWVRVRVTVGNSHTVGFEALKLE